MSLINLTFTNNDDNNKKSTFRAPREFSASIDENGEPHPCIKMNPITNTYSDTNAEYVKNVLKFDINQTMSHQDICEEFNRIAKEILYNMVLALHNNDNKYDVPTLYSIRELEFYYHHPKLHPDPFVHKSEGQKGFAKWYFHKKGKNYCGGTFKGLDIAFSNGTDIYAGILIRSIQEINQKDIDGDAPFIEGSCNCVNKILDKVGRDSIEHYISKSYSISVCGNYNRLYLYPASAFQDLIPEFKYFNKDTSQIFMQGPRVGLTLKKKTDLDSKMKYIFKPYRYSLTLSGELEKGKINLIIGSYEDHLDPNFIPKYFAKTMPKEINIPYSMAHFIYGSHMYGGGNKCIQYYNKLHNKHDKKKEDFIGKSLNAIEICELYSYIKYNNLD